MSTHNHPNQSGIWDGKPLMFGHSKYWEDCSIDEDWKRVRRKKLCECKECKNEP